MENIETNLSSSEFAPTGTITYDSLNVGKLNFIDDIEDYDNTKLSYTIYEVTTTGSDESFILQNGYEYGLAGNSRIGYLSGGFNAIGAFLFDKTAAITPNMLLDNSDSALGKMPKLTTFWEYLSDIWNQLRDTDKKIWENFWNYLVSAAFHINNKAQEYRNAININKADVDVFDYYFDFKLDPLEALPTKLKPELSDSKYYIRPMSVELRPNIGLGNEERLDRIYISPDDYYDIREIAIGKYLVIVPNDGSGKTIYKINNTLSSEEPVDRLESAVWKFDNDAMIKVVNTEDYTKSDYRILFKSTVSSTPSVTITNYTKSVDGVNGFKVDFTTAIATVGDLVDMIGDSINGFRVELYCDSTLYPLEDSATFYDGAIMMMDLPYYKPRSVANSRNIEYTKKKWVPYPGSSTSGEYVYDFTSGRYAIEIDGDLTDIEDVSFTMYITSALAYNIPDRVLSIKELETPDGDIIKDGIDYKFYNSIIEFNKDLFNMVNFNDMLYCSKAITINEAIYEIYGGLVGIDSWRRYRYDNVVSKAVIGAILMSLRDSSKQSFSRIMNVYYGLPIAPEDSKVYGLYESYAYEIVSINRTLKTLKLKTDNGAKLHKFFQTGNNILTNRGETVFIKSVDWDSAVIAVSDVSSIYDGDSVYLNLANKFDLQSFDKTNYEIVVRTNFSADSIQHVIDIYNKIYEGNKLPEIVVYDTDTGNDNTYRITAAIKVPGVGIKFKLYKPTPGEKYLYNNHIEEDIPEATKGFVHFEWPTHKFLLLWLKDLGRYHIAYLDAPIDTIYDSGDELSKYDEITRNSSSLNKVDFPGWFQYGEFKLSNGINEDSDILQLTSAIDGAKFGEYFPSDIYYINK